MAKCNKLTSLRFKGLIVNGRKGSHIMDRIVLKQQLTEFSVIYFGSSNVGHKFYIGNSGPKALALLALWVIRHCRSLGGRISPNLQL